MPYLLLVALAALHSAETRRVAFTIDDLPFVSASPLSNEEVRGRTAKLLEHLRRRDVPAVGFVNEGKLYEGASEDPERVGLLALWLDAGMDLGNHTCSHADLHATAPMEISARGDPGRDRGLSKRTFIGEPEPSAFLPGLR